MRLLTEKENIIAHAFASAHYARSCRNSWFPWRRNDCAKVTIEAVQTGIGFGIKVICPYCGDESNITDYESW